MRKAFTLTELLIGMLIMLITGVVMTLDSNKIGQQTAEREAERIAAYLRARMRTVDMTQDTLWITITSEGIALKAGEFPSTTDYTNAKLVDDPSFTTSKGCTFQDERRLVYPSTQERRIGSMNFKPIPSGTSVSISESTAGKYCLTVNGDDGKTYNVLIGAAN